MGGTASYRNRDLARWLAGLGPVQVWSDREGRDVVIFGLGRSASAAVGAAERLAEYGIACGVVNPVFVKPQTLTYSWRRRATPASSSR